MDLVRDLLELGGDLYWTTGLVVFAGGLIMFVIETLSILGRRRTERPRVVRVEVTQVRATPPEATAGLDSAPQQELGPPPATGGRPELPPGRDA